jgi:hypothetical protein
MSGCSRSEIALFADLAQAGSVEIVKCEIVSLIGRNGGMGQACFTGVVGAGGGVYAKTAEPQEEHAAKKTISGFCPKDRPLGKSLKSIIRSLKYGY